MKKITLLLLAVLGAAFLKAQPGYTCANPVLLGTSECSENQSMTGTELWFSVTATATSHFFQVSNEDTLNGYAEAAELYGNSCSSSPLFTASYLPSNKSYFGILASGLTPGQTYLLRVFRSAANPNDALINVCKQEWIASAAGGACDDPCNLVCNGSFENFTPGSTTDCINCAAVFTENQFNACLNQHCWSAIGAVEMPTSSIATPDYYNTCNTFVCMPEGFAVPHSCDGHAGFGYSGSSNSNLFREFVKQENIPLAAQSYKVSFYVRRKAGNQPAQVGFWLKQGSVATLSNAQTPTYVTSIPGNSSGYVLVTTTVTISAPGNYSLVIGVFDNTTSNQFGYFFLDDVTITAVPPAVTLPNPICSNSLFLAVAGSSGTYNWTCTPSFPGFPATGNVVSVTAPVPVGSYTINLVNTTTGGCSSQNIPFTVLAGPTASIVPSGQLSICSGGSVFLTATSSLPMNTEWFYSPNASGQGSQSLNCTGCFAYNATQPGYYYITVTDPVTGCSTTSNFVQLIQAAEPTVTATSTNETCDAVNNGTATAIPAGGTAPYLYTWSSFPIQTTATATGLTSGTYTVTVTDANGCTGTATTTISADPLPPPPVVTTSYGSAPNLCTSGQIVTYTVTNYNPLLTYVPSFNPTPSSVIQSSQNSWTVDWGSSCIDIDFTLNSYNSLPACSSSVTLSLPGCCGACSLGSGDALSNGITIATVQQLAAAYPGFFTIIGSIYTYSNPNGILYINGNLTAGSGITFRIINSEVRFGTNAAIVTGTGANTIRVSGSHLLAGCNDMWKGIIASGTSNSIIILNSLIEDAIGAVQSSQGASYTLTSSVFNKNYESVIAVLYAAQNHPGAISDCVFSCRQLPATATVATTKGVQVNTFIQVYPVANFAGTTLLPPYAGKRSSAGVFTSKVGTQTVLPNNQLSNVKDITIGQPGGYNTLNVFDNMDFGVFAQNSNVRVVNCAFQYITGPTTLTKPPGVLPGIAIYGTNDALNASRRFQVGVLPLTKNTFYECGRGVDLNGYYDVDVRENRFLSTIGYSTIPGGNPSAVGNVAVFIKTGRYISVKASENHIVNWDLGIHFINDALLIGPNTYTKFIGDARLSFNIVEPVLNNGAPTSQYIRNCIIAQSLVPVNCTFPTCSVQSNPNVGRLFIDGNELNNVYNGILMQGWEPRPRAVDNAITVRFQPNTLSLVNRQHGIRMIDCIEGIIYNNIITGANTLKQTMRGVYCTNNNAPYVRCNDIDQVGQCVVFEGSNLFTRFQDNKLRAAQDGFVMLNNAIISQQGGPGLPIDNYWYGPFSHAETYCDNTFSPNLLNSKLYVRAGAPYQPVVNLTNTLAGGSIGIDDYNLPGTIVFASGPFRNCNAPAPILPPGGNNNAANRQTLEAIAQNQLTFGGAVIETQWQFKQRTLQVLNQEPGFMTSSPVLQQFFNTMQPAAMGQIEAVNEQIGQNNISSAAMTNSSITANISIEQNQQTYNAIYMACIQGNAPTTQQVADLEVIAGQCWQEGGKVVFNARALLCLIYDEYRTWEDDCPVQSNHAMQQPEQTTTATGSAYSGVKLYPNPNDGNMTLEYNIEATDAIFALFDMTGRMIASHPLTPGQNVVTFYEQLPNGMYYYNVQADGKLLKHEKVVIVK